MITAPETVAPFPPPDPIVPAPGGLKFADVAPMICGVVDNGVCPDDPRVKVRWNEATKIAMDYLIPVGGMCKASVRAVDTILYLPPEMENAIEVHLGSPAKMFGSDDITQGWYEITSTSVYLDTNQQYDNPLVDLGLRPDPANPSVLRRTYFYPGLEPSNSIVVVTGARRFLPILNDQDYVIIQNVEALKLIIISIERNENAAPDEAQKYRQQGLEMLQAEVKKHLLDPTLYMLRKTNYLADVRHFAVNTLGWMRAQIALDLNDALKTGKSDLTWAVQQAERRLMERATWKDCVVTLNATVVGGTIYMPASVEAVLAINLDGQPIPIRSQFFQHLENGPGAFPCYDMLIDQGDHLQPGFNAPRRKYKLIANCQNNACITAVCKLRWILKDPEDMMTIKNYEAIRTMVSARFYEEAKDVQNAVAYQQAALDILDKELRAYLGGIRHTIHIQTVGFGLGDITGNYGGL